MFCELCKQKETHKNMSIALFDDNGVTYADLCQTCLRRIRAGIKSRKPQHLSVYPEKEEDEKEDKVRLL